MPTRERACVERLSRHVHPPDGRKAFCMIEAYMDESGIHDGAKICAVAGYWGNVKKWKKFEPRWSRILADADEPSLKEFHSTDFWYSNGSRKGVFARWSDTKADKFIDDLTQCIVDTKIFPTSAALVVDEWNKLNRAERKHLSGGYYNPVKKKFDSEGAPNKTYFFPFQLAIITPAVHCRRGLHVHYVFDLNKQFKNHALNLYGLLKKDVRLGCRHRLGSLDFETGIDAVGLQAADLLAYQTYKFAHSRTDRDRPIPVKEMPPLLRKLVTNGQDDQSFPFLDREGLNIALQSLPPDMRSEGWIPVRVELRRESL